MESPERKLRARSRKLLRCNDCRYAIGIEILEREENDGCCPKCGQPVPGFRDSSEKS